MATITLFVPEEVKKEMEKSKKIKIPVAQKGRGID